MRFLTLPRSWLLAALALGLGLGACGNEPTFSADEFAEKMHDNGVELQVGQRLFSADDSKEVYDISLEPLPGAPTPKEGALETPHGSMSIHDDAAGAGDQFRDCENTADLLCFRAANVVVVMEGGGLEAARLAAAMKKLEN